MGPNIARRHEQRRRERVRLVFHFRRRYLMHDNMPKFVREAEPLPISRHVAVEEDARWHIRYLNREAIHLERSEVAMDDFCPVTVEVPAAHLQRRRNAT